MAPKPKKKAAPKPKAKAKGKHPGGRPTSYRTVYAQKAYKLCLLGCTDAELANFLDVSESTLNLWKETHPKFSESIKAGKEDADANVAERMYNRAMGYTCPETKAQWVQDENGGRWEYAEMKKHYPPDTQAASLWLRNRQSKKWRDKVEAELSTADGKPLGIQVEFVEAKHD